MTTDDDRAGLLHEGPRSTMELWDWRRRVAALYAEARAMPEPDGWAHWRTGRERLFRDHPQSPVPPDGRAAFAGLPFHPYDPAFRVEAAVEPPPTDEIVGLAHSGDGATRAVMFGLARFEIGGRPASLPMYRLLAYGDGVFVPFRDASNGFTTYGGGRYLIDTVKGADLGGHRDRVHLDFNYAYHPSCVYDPAWSCPLAPPSSRLDLAVAAGERLPVT